MADVQDYIQYRLRWEDRRGDGKVEGYAPFDAVAAAGGVWEGGQALDPKDPDAGWYTGYILDSSKETTAAIVAACVAAGWEMVEVSAPVAVSKVRDFYEAQVTDKTDIGLGADGRADFSAVTWTDSLGPAPGGSAPIAAFSRSDAWEAAPTDPGVSEPEWETAGPVLIWTSIAALAAAIAYGILT